MLKKSAIIALSGLCLFSVSCDQSKRRNQKEALSEVKTSNNEMLDSLVMTDEGLEVDIDKVKQAQKQLKASGEKMGGKLGEVMKIAAELQGGINEAGEKCMKVADEVGLYLDMESFSKKRDYAAGIEKFKELITVNQETLDKFGDFKPEMTRRLDELGFTGKERKEFDTGFHKKWEKTHRLVDVIRSSDIETGKIGTALMEGLRKGDSQWEWDEDAGQIAFQSDELVEWYNSQMEKIRVLGEKQLKAQEELVEHMKAR
jgi:hypothetical protein